MLLYVRREYNFTMVRKIGRVGNFSSLLWVVEGFRIDFA